MKIWTRLILLVSVAFIVGIFYWALFSPKPDMSQRIYQTLKEQEKRADLSFKDVTFEEVVAGVKYWQLKAKTAMVNKSTEIATLQEAEGSFFKKGRPVLRFRSPAALWDMKRKEILLDKPLGYDVVLERKISSLLKTIKKSNFSIFNLPKTYKKELGYWFQAKNLSWKLTDEKLLCTGGIVLNKGEVTGYSEKLEGDVSLEKVVLEGEPKIVISPNHSHPVTLEAETFEVLSTQDLILAKGNPRVFWGEAEVTADDLKYLQKDEILQFTDNVRINYKDIKASGDSARYLTKDETIILEGNAWAEQAGSVLRGDNVSVSLKEKKISVLGKGKFIIPEEELKKE